MADILVCTPRLLRFTKSPYQTPTQTETICPKEGPKGSSILGNMSRRVALPSVKVRGPERSGTQQMVNISCSTPPLPQHVKAPPPFPDCISLSRNEIQSYSRRLLFGTREVLSCIVALTSNKGPILFLSRYDWIRDCCGDAMEKLRRLSGAPQRDEIMRLVGVIRPSKRKRKKNEGRGLSRRLRCGNRKKERLRRGTKKTAEVSPQ